MVDLEVQNQQFVIFGTDCYGILVIVGGWEWFLKASEKAKLLISRLFAGVLLVKVGILCDFLVVGFLKLVMAL